MKDLKLGIQMGYWGAQPPEDIIGIAKEAESLGYDAIWSAESWGSDVFTPLAWIGAHTSKIKLGTGIAQISARTPAATAMAAITLDHLTKGRVILGLGVSGPQVVEGWYGQPFSKPLSRTNFDILSGCSKTSLCDLADPIDVTIPSPTLAKIESSPAPPTSCDMFALTVTRALQIS